MDEARIQLWHPSPRETTLHQRWPFAHPAALWHQLAHSDPLVHCRRIQSQALQLLKARCKPDKQWMPSYMIKC